MVALYVVSAEGAVGKTTLCAGVGKYLVGEGKQVSFLKPVIAERRSDSDRDASFMKQVLGLSEPVDSLCPVMGKGDRLADRIREAYVEVSQHKDVVIVEGECGQRPDDEASQAAYEIARALKAKVLIVAGYSGQAAGNFIDSYKGFGDNLLGIVLNKVPKSRLKRVSEEIAAQFSQEGIAVLGVLPEDRALFTLTVGELAESIKGEILNNTEKSVELVENLMVGAMTADSGLDYFGRKANKAVVARSDRPDVQMAALETSTRCLVLSGGTPPIDYVRDKATEKAIPVVLTGSDTDAVVRSIEEALGKTRFHQEKKLAKLAEIMGKQLDFRAIESGLGLAA